MREVLATKQITVLEHPACSPGLARSDFLLFPKVKEILTGRHFDDPNDIRSNTTAALKAIPQNLLQNCFEGWTRRCHWCIQVASQGEFSNEVCSTFYRDEFRTLLYTSYCEITIGVIDGFLCILETIFNTFLRLQSFIFIHAVQ